MKIKDEAMKMLKLMQTSFNSSSNGSISEVYESNKKLELNGVKTILFSK
jgi:hypothetical protein